MYGMLLIQKWDSFEIDKPVVLSSRGEELKKLTFYDKWNIHKIMFALKLSLMNHSQSKSLGFWDTYVETISKRNAIYISNHKYLSRQYKYFRKSIYSLLYIVLHKD